MSNDLQFAIIIVAIIMALPIALVVVARIVWLWGRWADFILDRYWHRWKDRKTEEGPVPDNVTPHPSAPRAMPEDKGEKR